MNHEIYDLAGKIEYWNTRKEAAEAKRKTAPDSDTFLKFENQVKSIEATLATWPAELAQLIVQEQAMCETDNAQEIQDNHPEPFNEPLEFADDDGRTWKLSIARRWEGLTLMITVHGAKDYAIDEIAEMHFCDHPQLYSLLRGREWRTNEATRFMTDFVETAFNLESYYLNMAPTPGSKNGNADS